MQKPALNMARFSSIYIKFRSSLHPSVYRINALFRPKGFRAVSSGRIVSDKTQRIKSVAEIPGRIAIPILGSTPHLFLTSKPIGKRALEMQLEDFHRFGPIVKFNLPGVNNVNIFEPSEAEKVFRSEPKYPKRFNWPLMDFYRENRKKPAGVFFLNDHEWYKHRNVISKRILRPKEVADYVPVFNEIIDDFIPRLRSVRNCSGAENEVSNLDKELFKWSFESVSHVLFDKRFGVLGDGYNPEAQEFIASVGKFLDAAFPAMFVPVWFCKYIYETRTYKAFVENFDKMHDYAAIFIGNKLREYEEQDKLCSEVTDKSGKKVEFLKFLLSSKKLTKDDLLASVIDLLFAGVDTTSNTMQWVLYMMGKNPEKQDLLYQEVTSVLGNGERASAAALAKMPYLKAWVKETLRFYPVFSSLPRVLSEDLLLSGYKIPAGTQVGIMFYAMGRNEKIFKDANEFKPERWLRKHDSSSEEFVAFASLPFGFGTRMCIGRRLAETELYLLLARVVQEFVVQYPHSEVVEPFQRGVTMPDRPVRVKFVDRK